MPAPAFFKLTGSPITHATCDNDAVAVTDTPRSSTVVDTGPGSSVYNQVQKFTANHSGSGLIPTDGDGTLSCPIA